MAKATVTLTCKHCGKTFVHSTTKGCRTEANSWEAWAAQAIDFCPDCYAALREQEKNTAYAALVEKYNLPEITAVSDKQRNYAESLRRSYALRSRDALVRVADYDLPDIRRQEAMAREKGLPEEKIEKWHADVIAYFKSNYRYQAYVILTTGDARAIIDALK